MQVPQRAAPTQRSSYMTLNIASAFSNLPDAFPNTNPNLQNKPNISKFKHTKINYLKCHSERKVSLPAGSRNISDVTTLSISDKYFSNYAAFSLVKLKINS